MSRLSGGNKQWMVVTGLLLILAALLAVGIYIQIRMDRGAGEGERPREYTAHFMMIHDNKNDSFWEAVYRGAADTGSEMGIYIEDLGASMGEDYSTEDMLEMAIAAKVDGIMVEGSKSDRIKTLIGEADRAGIAVITMMYDVADSARKSYAGVNAYAEGEMYGNQILQILYEKGKGATKEDPFEVRVLVDTSDQSENMALVYASIGSRLAGAMDPVRVETVNVEREEEFNSDEAIRDLLLTRERRPDIIVCLNSVDTFSCCQAIVDYNLVGKVFVLGYYSSPEIRDWIRAGVLKASVTVDAEKLGEIGVNSLNHYIQQGYVNEYSAIELKLLTELTLDQEGEEETAPEADRS